MIQKYSEIVTQSEITICQLRIGWTFVSLEMIEHQFIIMCTQIGYKRGRQLNFNMFNVHYSTHLTQMKDLQSIICSSIQTNQNRFSYRWHKDNTWIFSCVIRKYIWCWVLIVDNNNNRSILICVSKNIRIILIDSLDRVKSSKRSVHLNIQGISWQIIID